MGDRSLLQDKQLRYSKKQQFLGDFFENLLKDSIKQESGQFFTPVPITQFIIQSLPIEEIIGNNIEKAKNEILPYTIDFAMGSGHFLTEIMDEYNKIIQKIDKSKITKPSTKKQIQSWQINEFEWAKNFVYGIELDYRLVKTSKIACFLNGDGLAQVIHADGLDSFSKSITFQNMLLSKKSDKDNPKFDILISNPPYSVKAFRNTINDGKNSFQLYNCLTDNSSEIECLFIERAKQLLNEDGFIGIVLPVSVLTNSGIYEKTRELIFQYFKIISIVSLGNQAFMATGTKTIILFMQRINNSKFNEIKESVESFFKDFNDVIVNGIKNAFSTYVNEVYENLIFEDYISFLKDCPTEQLKQNEIFRTYKDCSLNEIKKIEKDKLIYFIHTYSQKIILGDSKNKEIEKEFYGYEFSNRRGHEGIHIYRDSNGLPDNKLYNSNDRMDNNKLNSYILRNFLNEEIEEDIKGSPLREHIEYLRLSNLIMFDLKKFDKSINLHRKKKIAITSKYPVARLNDNILISLQSGKRNSKIGIKKSKTGIPSLGGEHIGLDGNVNLNNMRYIQDEYFANMKQGKIKHGDILICKDGALTGKVAFIGEDYPYKESAVNEHVFILRCNPEKIKQKYLFYFLFSDSGQFSLKANSQKMGPEGLNQGNIYNLQIPIPPIDIQEKIIIELDKIIEQRADLINKMYQHENQIADLSPI